MEWFELLRSLGVDRTVVERDFEDLDRCAPVVFRWLRRKGRITRIWGQIGWDDKPRGSPEFRVGPDGVPYPVQALVEFVGEDGASYLVEMNKRGGPPPGLIVRVHCHPRNLPAVEELLSMTSVRIAVVRTYGRLESLAILYSQTLRDFERVLARPTRYSALPRVLIEPGLGIVPMELTLEAWKGDRLFRFTFGDRLRGYTVEVDCDKEDVNLVHALLESAARDVPEAKARSLVSPIDVREYRWDHLGGLDEVREEIRELIEYPLKNSELYRHLGLKPPKGILLVGPPGTGKTTIAKILANETDSIFYAVSPADINSMWYGESERNIGRLFQSAREEVARSRTVIVFIDEVDGFYTNRDEMQEATRRAFGQLCTEMDGLRDLEGVVVIGATNRYQDLDPALVRPGRLDRKIFIGLPERRSREEIFTVHLRGRPLGLDVDIGELAAVTEGFSGAEIAGACQKAGYLAIRRYSREAGLPVVEIRGPHVEQVKVGRGDLLEAIEAVREEKARYEGGEG